MLHHQTSTGELPSPRPFVPTLTSEPGYATDIHLSRDYGAVRADLHCALDEAEH